jgi:hypothetical protein
VALAGVQLCPPPSHPRTTTHVEVPGSPGTRFGQPLNTKRLLLAQKSSLLSVFKQVQLVLPLQLIVPALPHLAAQWQSPFSTGVPPLLRHLRRALRVRASAL